MTAAVRAGQLAPYTPLAEPLLSFSSANPSDTDTHPLRGLVTHGPYSKNSLTAFSDSVRVAIVGPESGREGRRKILGNLRQTLRPSDRRDYVPEFPGFEPLFDVPLVPAPECALLDWPSRLDELGNGSPHERVRRAISQNLRQLADVRDQFDVAVVHLPDGWEPGLHGAGFDAHDELKAIAAELSMPTQVINDRTFAFPYAASLSWRLAIALYVKAGGTPWRLAPLPGIPADSAYIGLAYALRGNPQEARFVTCCSQLFDADGGGMQFVAYDARDPLDSSEDARRNPYLSRSDMRAVLARSLDLYRRRNGGQVPRRVAVHKTTDFKDDELAGVSDALAAVEEVECVKVTTNVNWRGVWLQESEREGQISKPDGYPVHRGTMVPLSGTSALLWVAGNAPSVAKQGSGFFQGGKSIPSPLVLTRQMGRGPLEVVASELLALTKMDWNNDALYDPVPVTIRYSQRLARIIANVPDLPRSVYPYRMFM
ncbi:MAG: nuclease PIN [Gemmatimonadetes bacterium]|nr:nuclease PIN [Acidimicrobiia bacterium]MYE73389.1 nuclease PIN [Acidimicrobiia bacterium]MYJ12443.1 nuclease PIN [Gemmatimonadota bacterium]